MQSRIWLTQVGQGYKKFQARALCVKEHPLTALLESITTESSCILETLHKIRFSKRPRFIRRNLKEFFEFHTQKKGHYHPPLDAEKCVLLSKEVVEWKRQIQLDNQPYISPQQCSCHSRSKGRDTHETGKQVKDIPLTPEPHRELLRTQRGSSPSEIMNLLIMHTAQEQSESSSNYFKTHRQCVNQRYLSNRLAQCSQLKI